MWITAQSRGSSGSYLSVILTQQYCCTTGSNRQAQRGRRQLEPKQARPSSRHLSALAVTHDVAFCVEVTSAQQLMQAAGSLMHLLTFHF